jgi:hypothetical protein
MVVTCHMVCLDKFDQINGITIERIKQIQLCV